MIKKLFIMLFIKLTIMQQSILTITSSNLETSKLTNYTFQIQQIQEIIIPINSQIIFQFPNQYQSQLNPTYQCQIINWPITIPSSPICSIKNLQLHITNCFPAQLTANVNSILQIKIINVTNPLYSGSISQFTGKIVNSTNDTVINTIFVSSLSLTNSIMSCNLTAQPTQINSQSSLIITFQHNNYFPSDSLLRITIPKYWPRNAANTTSSQIISSSSTINCLAISNANTNLNCQSNPSSSFTSLTIKNIATSNIINSISFSINSILNPPSIQPQGSISITSQNNNKQMQECTNLKMNGITSGSISNPSFITEIKTINAISKSYLQFSINSFIISNDSIQIQFPNTIGITQLTEVLITNGNYYINNPSKNNNTIKITGLNAQKSAIVSIQLTNITNPPSQTTTQTFIIQILRSNSMVQQLKTSLKFNARRGIITIKQLLTTSLEIGFISNYTFQLQLSNPLQQNSILIIIIPSIYQNRIQGCLPSPCTISNNKIQFSSLNQPTSIIINLINVKNPLQLGSTPSFIVYTQLNQNDSTSIVDQITTGLSFVLIARTIISSQVTITTNSQIVYFYPTTISLTIKNNNQLPAYTSIIIELPTTLTISSGNQICNYGNLSISCSYNPTQHSITTSYLSNNKIQQNSLQKIQINNLYNPPSTSITTSFNISLINSNQNIIQYINNGLNYQINTPTQFNTLSILPNNYINSAITQLTISYSIPMKYYVNQSVLIINFPNDINVQSITCQSISSNLISVNCSKSINIIKSIMIYNNLAHTIQSNFKIIGYKNYPSLKDYTLNIQLVQDTLQTAKICSNNANLISIRNTQLGSISLSDYSFNNKILLQKTSLSLTISQVSSNQFSNLHIRFPSQFQLQLPASCILPSDLQCQIINTNIYNIKKKTNSSLFILPLQIIINNIITPHFTPSTIIYLQSYTSQNFMMDRNQQIIFTTSCTLPCKLCSSINVTICTQCYSNTTLVNNRVNLQDNSCKSFCDINKFINSTTNQCQSCSTVCQTCQTFRQCLSCTNSTYLFNLSCLNQCPQNYYPYNSQCFQCSSSLFCQSCQNSHSCKSCKIGYFLYATSCSQNCPQSITYKNSINRTCQSCPQNCTICIGTQIQVNCTQCQNGYLLDNNRCYLQCITLTLLPLNKKCESCSIQCVTCSILITNCTSCNDISSTPYLHNYRCLSLCPSTYYTDNSTFTCQKCNSPCLICLNVSHQSCISCQANYLLFETLCLSSCPTTYWNNNNKCIKCNSPCYQCTSQFKCTSCINSYYLYGHNCVSSCGQGLTIINNNQCLVCSSQCKTCSSSSFCTSCYPSNFLYNGTCNIICPSLTYANSANSLCETCNAPCQTCSSSTFCLSCINTLYLQNGACVVTCTSPLININQYCVTCDTSCLTCIDIITKCIKCATNYYYFSNNQTCTQTCSLIISSTTNNTINNQCVINCQQSYYLQTTNTPNQCKKCLSTCNTCTSITNCTQCINNYYFYQNTCLSVCPSSNPYNKNGICVLCNITNCQTCNNSVNCQTCQSNFLLTLGSCISNCPSHQTYNSTTQICQNNPTDNTTNTNTTNTNGTSTTSNVKTSEVPAYLFSMILAGLTVIAIISRLQYSNTNMIISFFIIGSLCLTASLIHLLFLQITIILSSVNFTVNSLLNLSITNYLLFTISFLHIIVTLVLFITLLCIRDPSIILILQENTLATLIIFLLCLIDYKIIWILQTGIFSLSIFQTKYCYYGSVLLIRTILYMAIVQILLTITYAIIKLITNDGGNTSRLLNQLNNSTIDQPYLIEAIVIGSLLLIMAIGVLVIKISNYYKGEQSKYNQNNQSVNFLMQQQVFEKRKNQQLKLDMQDYIGQDNSLNLLVQNQQQKYQRVWTKRKRNQKNIQQLSHITQEDIDYSAEISSTAKQNLLANTEQIQFNHQITDKYNQYQTNNNLQHEILSVEDGNSNIQNNQQNIKQQQIQHKGNIHNNEKNKVSNNFDGNSKQYITKTNQQNNMVQLLGISNENHKQKSVQQQQKKYKNEKQINKQLKTNQQLQVQNLSIDDDEQQNINLFTFQENQNQSKQKIKQKQQGKEQMNQVNADEGNANGEKQIQNKDRFNKRREKIISRQKNKNQGQEEQVSKEENNSNEKHRKLSGNLGEESKEQTRKISQNNIYQKDQDKNENKARKSPQLKKNSNNQIQNQQTITKQNLDDKQLKGQSNTNKIDKNNTIRKQANNTIRKQASTPVIYTQKQIKQNIKNQNQIQLEKEKSIITERPPIISNTPLSMDSKTYSNQRIQQYDDNQSKDQLQDANIYQQKLDQKQCDFILSRDEQQYRNNRSINRVKVPSNSKRNKNTTQEKQFNYQKQSLNINQKQQNNKPINNRRQLFQKKKKQQNKKLNTISFQQDLNQLNQVIPTPQKKSNKQIINQQFIDDIQIYDQKPSQLLMNNKLIQKQSNQFINANHQQINNTYKPSTFNTGIKKSPFNKEIIFQFNNQTDQQSIEIPKINQQNHKQKRKNYRYKQHEPQPRKPSQLLNRGSFQKIGEMVLEQQKHIK